MARSQSPLRYPGGKSSLADVTIKLIQDNDLGRSHYIEPYAGGASLALHLLFNRHVSDIHLNDLDLGIWSFWHAVLNDVDHLIEKIEKVTITVEEWHRQKAVYRNAACESVIDLAFATFFLNRTNRSGIIGSGGIIGGLNQSGNYKIDCRFNKKDLIEKVRKINGFRKSIHLTNMDACDFISWADMNLSSRSFFMIDPPYYEKGSSLYTNFYSKGDHRVVSQAISALSKPWVLTYDNCTEISDIYGDFEQLEFGIQYSANEKRMGKELMIISKRLSFGPEVLDALIATGQNTKAA